MVITREIIIQYILQYIWSLQATRSIFDSKQNTKYVQAVSYSLPCQKSSYKLEQKGSGDNYGTTFTLVCSKTIKILRTHNGCLFRLQCMSLCIIILHLNSMSELNVCCSFSGFSPASQCHLKQICFFQKRYAQLTY